MALAEAGDEVHVISYALPSRLSFINSRLYYHEVTVPRYPLFEYPPYSRALATTMVEVARHQNLDLIHVHYAVPNAVSAVLARQIMAPRRLPVVTTLHGTDVTLVGIDPSYRATTRFGIVESDAVTAVSRALRAATLEQLGLDKPIEVIYNFIDPARFDPALLRPRHRPAGRPPLGLPGREADGPHLELPAAQAGARRGRDLPPGPPAGAGPPADGRRRSRPARSPSATAASTTSATPSPSSAPSRWSRRPWSAPTSSCSPRRPSRSGSPCSRRWPARCRWWPPPPAACPRWWPTARPATCGRWATSTRWRRRRSPSSPTTASPAASPPPAAERAIAEFSQDKMVGRYRSLYERVLAGVPSP